MSQLKIAVVSPSGTYTHERLTNALKKAESLNFSVMAQSGVRSGFPSFLNGDKSERILELEAAEQLDVDALWAARGGCGAIELWHDYQKSVFEQSRIPLIGYSDTTILHFIRFYQAGRIGIHGPSFLELGDAHQPHLEALILLIKRQAHTLVYPPLKPVNHFLAPSLSGELIPMNLMSLASLTGSFNPQFLRGKILAIEDVNEAPYKIFRSLRQLKNAGALIGIKAMIAGQFGAERSTSLDEVMAPLANELGIPLFDWPIFGHEKPNWPLLFGAQVTIAKVDEHFFTLTYNEQHDHSPISHA